MGDLLHASRDIPFITFERQVDLSALVTARALLVQPPSWAAVIAKAFALVAARYPELRRTYVRLPWPRLWEADESVAAVAVEREYQGEQGVFFGMLKSPHRKALAELSDTVNDWKTKPLEEVAIFRRLVRYARPPLPLRRLLWWWAMSWSGKLKVRNFGTFGISLTGAAGATATNLIGPATVALNCGVIQANGLVDLRLHFDHRVMDGMSAARALAELEKVLNLEIVMELEALGESVPGGIHERDGDEAGFLPGQAGTVRLSKGRVPALTKQWE
jgi:hypothetical protein